VLENAACNRKRENNRHEIFDGLSLTILAPSRQQTYAEQQHNDLLREQAGERTI
jgi:hypothetical protein